MIEIVEGLTLDETKAYQVCNFLQPLGETVLQKIAEANFELVAIVQNGVNYVYTFKNVINARKFFYKVAMMRLNERAFDKMRMHEDDLTEDERKLMNKYLDNYASFIAVIDEEIERVNKIMHKEIKV